MFLQHLAVGGDGWKAWQTSPKELALLLSDPCAGAKRIALDPLPEMFADPLLVDLVSVDKDRFLERYLERTIGSKNYERGLRHAIRDF